MCEGKTSDASAGVNCAKFSIVDGDPELPSMSYRAKFLTSCAVWYCSFALGLSVSFLGTSLLELSNKFGEDVSVVSKVFTIAMCSYLLGAVIFGIIFNHVNRQLATVILLIIMGIGNISYPLVPTLVFFFCMAGVVGFAASGYETAEIIWIMEIWGGHNAGPYIQVQHFVFALGTFVSPLLVKPFLSEKASGALEYNLQLLNDSKSDMDRTLYSTMTTTKDQGFKSVNSTSDTLYIPFLIGGLISIGGALMILVMYCVKPYVKPGKVTGTLGDGNGAPQVQGTGGLAKSWNFKKAVLVFLTSLLLLAVVGMEMSTIQFLPTFTHFISLQQLSGQDGALILSGLTGAFTIGRGIGIPIILKVLPETLLVANIILVTLGNSTLYFFSSSPSWSYSALWIGGIFLGLGYSTMFPCICGYIERYVRMSNVVGGCMVVGGAIGDSVYPLIIGSWIQTLPFVLMYMNYVSIAISIGAFSAIYVITKRDDTAATAVNDACDREQHTMECIFKKDELDDKNMH